MEENNLFIERYLQMFGDLKQAEYYNKRNVFTCEIDLTKKCDAGCLYYYAQSTMDKKEQIPTKVLLKTLFGLKK